MRNKITVLVVLALGFLTLAGMSSPTAAGCDCNAHARTNVPTAK